MQAQERTIENRAAAAGPKGEAAMGPSGRVLLAACMKNSWSNPGFCCSSCAAEVLSKPVLLAALHFSRQALLAPGTCGLFGTQQDAMSLKQLQQSASEPFL
jgi:hypothetical protein